MPVPRLPAARAATTATHEGTEFVRSFVVVGRRVLHFWMLAEQARKGHGVRASVRVALVRRLAIKPRRKPAKGAKS